jgi:hypothetical protein
MRTMLEKQQWLSPEEWARYGHGRSWTFAVPTADMVQVAQAVASRRGSSFELLACSRTKVGDRFLSTYTRQSIRDLSLDGPWQYFIRDPSLSPAIPAPEPLPGQGWPAIFAVNGLVLLHHPEPGQDGDPPPSSIGIVHRVVQLQTEEIREHAAYDAIFAALKRELRVAMK